MQTELNRWRELSVRTLSPQGLVVFALDGALQKIALAREAISRGAVEEAHLALTAAQDVLMAVARALNPTWPPTGNLRRLLDFAVRRLRDSNWHKDAAPLDEVEPILRALSDAVRRMGEGAPAAGVAAGVRTSTPRGVDFAG